MGADGDFGAELVKLLDPTNFFLILLTLVGVVGVTSLLRRLQAAMTVAFPAYRLLVSQWVTVLNFLVYLGGGAFLAVTVLRSTPALLLTISGGAGVAIGFALKDIAASILAGITLLFDKPFQVGDRVRFQDFEGDIIDIGLRTVRLFTLSHDTVTIPNSVFITEAVASGNFGAYSMMVDHDFHVALDADLEKGMELIREVLLTSRYLYLNQPVTVTAAEVAVAERLAVRLRGKAYVLDTRYAVAFQTDVTCRVSRLFAEHQIGRPQG